MSESENPSGADAKHQKALVPPGALKDDGNGSSDTPPHLVAVIPPDQLNVIKWRFWLGVSLAGLAILVMALLLWGLDSLFGWLASLIMG